MTIPAGFSSVRKQSISRKTSSLKSWTRLRKAIHFSKAFFKASKYQFLLRSSVKCHFIPSLSSLDQPNSCQVSILPLLELHEGSRTPCKCSQRCTASIWVRRILLRRFVHFNSTPLFDSLQTETRMGSIKVGSDKAPRGTWHCFLALPSDSLKVFWNFSSSGCLNYFWQNSCVSHRQAKVWLTQLCWHKLIRLYNHSLSLVRMVWLNWGSHATKAVYTAAHSHSCADARALTDIGLHLSNHAWYLQYPEALITGRSCRTGTGT